MLPCQHIPCADPFRAATLMLQTFETMIKEFLGRGSILSDAVGVDGLTYVPSLPLLSLLDGLKPCLLLLHLFGDIRCNKCVIATLL